MPRDAPTSQDPRLQVTTRKDAGSIRRKLADEGVVGLTVLWHPDPRRVGEEAGLTSMAGQGEGLSRLTPHFTAPGGKPRPLTDPHLSREPLCLLTVGDGVRIAPGGTEVEVDGTPLTTLREVARRDLETGVVLLLARRVVLLLHFLPSLLGRPPSYEGLIGESAAMLRLREQMHSVADLEDPVLLRGESGTGKELVARALHAGGKRRGEKFVAINVGSLRPERAAADLFGAARGAFTGATQALPGFFKAADRGTLFLDEIGETPVAVQVLLLRALENGEIQPLGTVAPVAVDVRLISATDKDLAAAMEGKEFRAPLYHRLATCQLELPPLRARRADFGRLFFHFLREALASVGENHRLDCRDEEIPWVPARLVARLVSYHWPGNVRELRNETRQLVIFNRGKPEFSIPDRLERLLAENRATAHGPRSADGGPAAEEEPPPARKRRPEDLGASEVCEALREADWVLSHVAEALGISRPSVDSLMVKYGIRRACDLHRDEIVDALRQSEGRVGEAARRLEVSRRGLQLQMTRLHIQ